MKRFLNRWITHNWQAKVACVLFALGLWFWVNIQETGVEQFEVQLEYENVEEGLIVSERSSRIVHVDLRGPKTTLLRTTQNDLRARLPILHGTPGEYFYSREEIRVDHPPELTVERIQPSELRVLLEEQVETTVPVTVSVAEEPPEGYEFTHSSSPDTMLVRGSRQVMETLDSIELRALDLSERESSFTLENVTPELPQGIEMVYPPDGNFNIDVEITEIEVERIFEDVPVDVVDIPAGFRATAEPDSKRLTVRGPMRIVENLSQDDIRIEVTSPEESRDQIKVARIVLPDNVEYLEAEPDNLTVRIRLEDL